MNPYKIILTKFEIDHDKKAIFVWNKKGEGYRLLLSDLGYCPCCVVPDLNDVEIIDDGLTLRLGGYEVDGEVFPFKGEKI